MKQIFRSTGVGWINQYLRIIICDVCKPLEKQEKKYLLHLHSVCVTWFSSEIFYSFAKRFIPDLCMMIVLLTSYIIRAYVFIFHNYWATLMARWSPKWLITLIRVIYDTFVWTREEQKMKQKMVNWVLSSI